MATIKVYLVMRKQNGSSNMPSVYARYYDYQRADTEASRLNAHDVFNTYWVSESTEMG